MPVLFDQDNEPTPAVGTQGPPPFDGPDVDPVTGDERITTGPDGKPL